MPAPFRPVLRTVTIASGQTVSDAERCDDATIVGIVTPAALTGIAFTFQVSADSTNGTDGTFVPLRATPGGAALSFTVAAAGAYQVDPVNFMAWKWVKVVSGSAEAADRVIALIVRPVA
jgi:hypothetical protein